MKECTIIFPHQLFKSHPALGKGRIVVMVEEWLFFSQYPFHKHKIILHRASMQWYRDLLVKKGTEVLYIDATDPLHDIRQLVPHLSDQGFKTIHYADPVDNWLNKRLKNVAKEKHIELIRYSTPSFLNTMEDVEEYFNKSKKYFQTDFYTWQRKKRNILLEADGKPLGGKWTFDNENRKKLPKNFIVPNYAFPPEDSYLKEAISYTNNHFSKNIGGAEAPFRGRFPWAWTFEGAEILLKDFLKMRLSAFGDYEDAFSDREPFLFHSILSPMLNTGLLEPEQVIEETFSYASQNDIPLNALEGFVRQVLGWREFIRIVYEREGSVQRTKNYWQFSRKIPSSFWTGNTGIVPVDNVIKKSLRFAYAHHIERLMVMGNFFLLCEFDPDEVYQWFMEMYIDAYDWVMVPNTYGMTQFADGGLMTTKPYISGSNYLLKMGNWDKSTVLKTGRTWMETWDGLFWRFMHVHRKFFLSNPRLGMLVNTFDKMTEDKQKQHLLIAEEFLKTLDS
jgi:deoxyribodipyrimidine photolyase-related protein